MFYYEIAVLGYPKDLLTYSSTKRCTIGDQVEVELRNKTKKGALLKEVECPSFRCLEFRCSDFRYSKEQIDLARFISAYYFCSMGEAISLFEPFLLFETNYPNITIDVDIELSSLQNSALEFIKKNRASLLFGDTGSGKTEIYIKFLAEIINAQKCAIFLMPEISLTPQMEGRLKSYFGDMIAIWHSKVSKKRKKEIIQKIEKGEIRIVAGARSALFLPLPNLGAIVVDEEHDDAYKSQSRPRYNAKDLSLYMAKQRDIHVILGSATPSVVSYYKIPHFRLKGRYFQTKKSIYFEESDKMLTSEVLQKLDSNLKKGEQSIVFIPTRGNFKYQICLNCKESIECPYCSVSMSIHRAINALKCHYCGYVERIANRCPHCGSEEFSSAREGSAEVVEKLGQMFPDAKISKFDRDEITSDTKLKKVLKSFNNGDIDILVGTQMLSKGHDYHNVSLVIVLGIDYVLKSADYRARERAISLLEQISGRSGRKRYGEVLIQSLNQPFFSEYIDNYEAFLKDELHFRKELYPPFLRLSLLIFSHKDERVALESKDLALKILKESKVEIVGAQKAPIFKISQKYRYQILLRSSSTRELLYAITLVKNSGSEVEIDMDPLSLS